MLGYLLQRLLGALSVLFVVSLVAFGLYALTPGDPAVVLLEASGIHSPPREAVEAPGGLTKNPVGTWPTGRRRLWSPWAARCPVSGSDCC